MQRPAPSLPSSIPKTSRTSETSRTTGISRRRMVAAGTALAAGLAVTAAAPAPAASPPLNRPAGCRVTTNRPYGSSFRGRAVPTAWVPWRFISATEAVGTSGRRAAGTGTDGSALVPRPCGRRTAQGALDDPAGRRGLPADGIPPSPVRHAAGHPRPHRRGGGPARGPAPGDPLLPRARPAPQFQHGAGRGTRQPRIHRGDHRPHL